MMSPIMAITPRFVAKPIVTTLLTMEEVDAWREELRLLKQSRDEASRRIKTLEEKLQYAQPFVQDHVIAKTINEVATKTEAEEEAVEEQVVPPVPDPNETMHDVILRILKNHPGGLVPKEISQLIRTDPSVNERVKHSHPNYLYTAIMRLVNKELISKSGSKYKFI